MEKEKVSGKRGKGMTNLNLGKNYRPPQFGIIARALCLGN